MTHVQRKPQVAILFFLVSFASTLGMLYAPALPALTQYFQITKGQAQETGSIYLAGCLLAQLIYAPLAGALGRKLTLYIGGALAVLGSALCLIAIALSSFPLLLFGRGLTAFGAACGVMLTNILLTDAFSSTDIKKILAYLMGGFAVIPALGITLGGLLTQYFSWQSCFVFMLLYACAVLGLCFLLPETGTTKQWSHLHPMKIGRAYLSQFGNVRFMLYVWMIACSASFLYLFSMEAPFIATHQLHIPAHYFGLYNLIPNIGLLLGSIVAARLSHQFSSRRLVLMGGGMFFLFSLIMWVMFEMNFVNTFTLFGLPLLIFFAAPIISSHGQACALAASVDKTYASAVIYITQYFWVMLTICALSLAPAHNVSILPLVYALSGMLILILWVISRIKTKATSV